jgi:hypothetical protein
VLTNLTKFKPRRQKVPALFDQSLFAQHRFHRFVHRDVGQRFCDFIQSRVGFL